MKDLLKLATPFSILALAGSVLISSPHSPLAEKTAIPVQISGDLGLSNPGKGLTSLDYDSLTINGVISNY